MCIRDSCRVPSASGSPRDCGPTLLPRWPPRGWRPPRPGPRAGWEGARLERGGIFGPISPWARRKPHWNFAPELVEG
eukprot:11834558-Alexandrium_andersonii.AAC.1